MEEVYEDGEGVVYYREGRGSRDNQSISRVIVEEGVTVVERNAFQNCVNLQSVEFPPSLREIHGHAFERCTSLRKITFADGAQVLKDSAFAFCENLTELDLPDTVAKVQSDCFEGCSRLTRVRLPQNNNLQLGFHAFFQCTNLVDVEIPEGLRVIYSLCFAQASSLRRIVIPDSVIEIHNRAFFKCHALKQVIFSPGSKLTRINMHAFASCSALERIKIPYSVDTIGREAFSNCHNLLSIHIPNKESIDIRPFAFYECDSLTRIQKLEPTSRITNTISTSILMSQEKWRSVIQGINHTMGLQPLSAKLRMDTEGYRGPLTPLPVVLWPNWFELIGHLSHERGAGATTSILPAPAPVLPVVKVVEDHASEKSNTPLQSNLIFRQLQKYSSGYIEHRQSYAMSLSRPRTLATTDRNDCKR